MEISELKKKIPEKYIYLLSKAVNEAKDLDELFNMFSFKQIGNLEVGSKVKIGPYKCTILSSRQSLVALVIEDVSSSSSDNFIDGLYDDVIDEIREAGFKNNFRTFGISLKAEDGSCFGMKRSDIACVTLPTTEMYRSYKEVWPLCNKPILTRTRISYTAGIDGYRIIDSNGVLRDGNPDTPYQIQLVFALSPDSFVEVLEEKDLTSHLEEN